jgi:succinate-semialdehyde dehydrogenase/glutarate-semialdehyde dehydrogenase
MTHTKLFIDGRWVEGQAGAQGDVLSPFTGEVIGTFAVAGAADLEDAVQAANRVFPTWRDSSSKARANVLLKAAAICRARAAELAEAITREMGKPGQEAQAEAASSAELLEWFAGEAQRFYGHVVPARTSEVIQTTLKQPVGPVAAFTPWNFPLSQLVRKLGAALAAGCTVVAKPPEDAPASAAVMAEIFQEAGLPDGVLNIVYGIPHEISAHLVPHPKIRKISFTGSVPVGKQLAALAGKHMKRITMELGGHNPAIVRADANIEQAAKALAFFKFRNAGQVCISPSRILVDQRVAAPFLEAFAAEAKAIRLTEDESSAAGMGPLASERRLSAVTELVDEAAAKGAELVTGGAQADRSGYYFEPTVLANVPAKARIMNEEPFGPVAMVQSFETLDEAIAEANRLDYGLSAFAFTASIATSARLQNQLETGMLAINHTLFGLPELHLGGVKDSGFGSEGGREAIESYLVSKLVTQAAEQA